MAYALVTGASSGIGYQFAQQLAERGYNLVMVSNEAAALNEAAAHIGSQYKIDVDARYEDLGRQQAAEELHDYCKKRGYAIEVLVNNAGVYHDKDFLDDSQIFNELIFNLHMFTPAMLTYHFGKDMALRKKGYILNVSSITSRIAVQRLSTYGATKAFLHNFTRSVHIELYHQGVKVTAIRPGAVNTGLYSISDNATKMGLTLGLIVTPEHLARQALRAMFRGRCIVTPGLCNHLLLFFIALLPTGLLRLVRKWNWF